MIVTGFPTKEAAQQAREKMSETGKIRVHETSEEYFQALESKRECQRLRDEVVEAAKGWDKHSTGESALDKAVSQTWLHKTIHTLLQFEQEKQS